MRTSQLLLLLVLLAVAASAMLVVVDDTPSEIERYLEEQGPVIEQHLFRSRVSSQIVVSFCVDENLKGGRNEGASNPANVHCEAVLFENKGKWVFADKAFLGQGSIRGFWNGKARGESVTYAPGDPLCCPSKKEEIVFSTKGGTLVVAQEI